MRGVPVSAQTGLRASVIDVSQPCAQRAAAALAARWRCSFPHDFIAGLNTSHSSAMCSTC